MSKKQLLDTDKLKILENKLTEYKDSNPTGSSNNFYIGLKAFYPQFNEYEDKQLDNQIIAQRRLSNEKRWPKFSSY